MTVQLLYHDGTVTVLPWFLVSAVGAGLGGFSVRFFEPRFWMVLQAGKIKANVGYDRML